MKEARGNLWDFIGQADAICITTNKFVKRDGTSVMGRGCAKEATRRYPGIAKKVGDLNANVKLDGFGIVQQDDITNIVAFPVKSEGMILQTAVPGKGLSNIVEHMRKNFTNGNGVPGWALQASPWLIEASARRLVRLADENGWTNVVLPRPGCGAGELKWEGVYMLLNQILDDRFTCVTF